MWYFCHAQLFETTHAENIKSPLVQHSCLNAKVVEAFCEADYRPSTRYSASLHAHMHVVWVCRCAHDRGHRSHAISIALAALPAPNFPRLRALALFGRRPPEREASHHCRRPKTCTATDSCTAANISFIRSPRPAATVDVGCSHASSTGIGCR